MLTKKDVNQIDELMKKNFKLLFPEGIAEFWESIIAPYLDQEHKINQKEHKEILDRLDEKVDDIADYVKDHEKRITRLETTVSY